MKWPFLVAVLVAISNHSARATDLGCVSTTFNALSPNDKVCVSVFEDPQVPGIVCDISQARKGGWGQPLGLNEDPSNFSVVCRQIGADHGRHLKAARAGGGLQREDQHLLQ